MIAKHGTWWTTRATLAGRHVCTPTFKARFASVRSLLFHSRGRGAGWMSSSGRHVGFSQVEGSFRSSDAAGRSASPAAGRNAQLARKPHGASVSPSPASPGSSPAPPNRPVLVRQPSVWCDKKSASQQWKAPPPLKRSASGRIAAGATQLLRQSSAARFAPSLVRGLSSSRLAATTRTSETLFQGGQKNEAFDDEGHERFAWLVIPPK